MMSYPHSPSDTLDGTLEELRTLLRSWVEALPLLHPYASSARWRLRRPAGDMVAEGTVTRDRVTARFGWSGRYGEPVTAVPPGPAPPPSVSTPSGSPSGAVEPAGRFGAAHLGTSGRRTAPLHPGGSP